MTSETTQLRYTTLGNKPFCDTIGDGPSTASELSDTGEFQNPRSVVEWTAGTTADACAGAGTWPLVSHDPNGAKVELDFDASEDLD